MAPAQVDTQIRVPNFQRFEATMQQRPCHAANMWVGRQLNLLSAAQVRSSQGLSSDLVLQHGRGEREQMASSSVPPQAKTALLVTNF